MSSYVASTGTVWRISAALACSTIKIWAAFSLGIQFFCTATASNCRWNTAQDVAPSNFGGLTVMVLAPGPPPPARLDRASAAANWTSNSSRRFTGLLFHHRGDIFLLLIQPLFQLCLTNAQVTYLCFEPLPNCTHTVAHLVLYGMHLSHEVSSNLAHVRLQFCTYVTLQWLLSGTKCTSIRLYQFLELIHY